MPFLTRYLPSFFGPEQTNATVFANILKFYLPTSAHKRVLDATAGKKRFWENVQGDLFDWSNPYDVTFMDLRDRQGMDLLATFTVLPFQSRSFDCVVYDPPYGGEGAGGMARGEFAYSWQENDISFGFDTTTTRLALMTKKFGLEAARVLKTHGLLITKCMDLARRFIHIELIKWLPRFRMIDCVIYAVALDKPLRPHTRRNIKQSHKLHNYFQVWEKFGR